MCHPRAFLKVMDQDCHLSIRQSRILAEIHHLRGASVIDIARSAELDQATVSAAIRKLATCGLIVRRTHVGSDRTTIVTMAPAGIRLINQAIEAGRDA